MKTRAVIMATMLAVWSATIAQALDRDARVIGQAGVEYVSFKDMNATRVVVWDETALNFEREWAIVAGAGVGQLSGSGTDGDQTMLFAALGAKWYPVPLTSLQLIGTGEWLTSGNGFRVVGATASVEQRFVTRQAALSPFLTLSASLQNAQIIDGDSFTCFVLKAGAGCDLIMSDDVTLVFSAALTESQDSGHNPNRDYADGWIGTVALKYFWF